MLRVQTTELFWVIDSEDHILHTKPDVFLSICLVFMYSFYIAV